jgi:hypothetical protein
MATYSSFKKITTEGIINGAVTGATLATNSVVTADFASASVRTSDIQDGAVGTTQLASTIDLSLKTVSYRPIVNADIAAAAITGAQLASGAIVNNIGYTPVNKAGDTLSGQLRLPVASAGTPAVASSGNTNTGIFFAGTDQVQISTAAGNSNSFVRNGSNIAHVQPNMPAFHASGNGGWYYGNTFGGTGRWTELNTLQPGGGWPGGWQIGAQKGGSNLSTNGRFTAPVSGWYSFYHQTYAYNDTNNSAGYTHWNIGYNGSISTDRTTGRTPHTLYGHQVSANHIPGIMCTLEIYLNASDYAIPQPYMAGSFRIHGDHSLWCGYLIG